MKQRQQDRSVTGLFSYKRSHRSWKAPRVFWGFDFLCDRERGGCGRMKRQRNYPSRDAAVEALEAGPRCKACSEQAPATDGPETFGAALARYIRLKAGDNRRWDESWTERQAAKAKKLTRLSSYAYLADRNALEQASAGEAPACAPGCDRHWLCAFGADTPVEQFTAAWIRSQLARWNDTRRVHDIRVMQLSGVLNMVERESDGEYRNPARYVSKFNDKNKREFYLKPEQLHALVAAAYKAVPKKYHRWVPVLQDYVLFGAATGVRREPMVEARASWVHGDDDDMVLDLGISKNGKHHALPVAGELVALVKRRVAATSKPFDRLFPGPEGGSIYPALRRYLPKMAQAAGIPWGARQGGLSIHALRHSFATIALESGADPRDVQAVGNWCSEVFKDYDHAVERTRAAAGRFADATVVPFPQRKADIA